MKLYDVSAIIGEYEKDGKMRNRYLTIGVVLETKTGGKMIKLDAIPVGWDGIAFLNHPSSKRPKPHEGTEQTTKQTPDKELIGLEDITFNYEKNLI